MNIAKILVETPRGTKLWSPVMGVAELDTILCDETHTFYIQVKDVYGYCYKFTESGRLSKNGECLLFPSKEMRDWSKFSWKRGDVLKSERSIIIFDKWYNDCYDYFSGAHQFLHSIYSRYEVCCPTEDYEKATEEEAKELITKIEKKLGGKLNLETLEIEKLPEFKDGDFVYVELKNGFKDVSIFQRFLCQNRPATYVDFFLDEEKPILADYGDYNILCEGKEIEKIRLATVEERQQLFDALAKAGKRWNAETKTLEDLPKKHEFKPFDRVLVRDENDGRWCANLFGFIDNEAKDYKYVCVYDTWKQCVPYDGNERLLGTTGNPKE